MMGQVTEVTDFACSVGCYLKGSSAGVLESDDALGYPSVFSAHFLEGQNSLLNATVYLLGLLGWREKIGIKISIKKLILSPAFAWAVLHFNAFEAFSDTVVGNALGVRAFYDCLCEKSLIVS